jgi:hypothetical protein
MPNRRTARTWEELGKRPVNAIFLDHPRSLGEGYWQHQRHALRFGATLIGAGFACLIHALIPALFERTGSTAVAQLHDQMVALRRLRPAPRDPAGSFARSASCAALVTKATAAACRGG